MQRTLSGTLGAFGGGMGLKVIYLQCAIPVTEIRQITLAEELPGSDEWPIRDLFQRDVDHQRVDKFLVPWLQNQEKIKFFAPITLAIMPFNARTGRIDSIVPSLHRSADGKESNIGNLISIRSAASQQTFGGQGDLAWDAERCHLVALDGQHRVAALREIISRGKRDSSALIDWSIPAVVMCVTQESDLKAAQKVSYLDVARSVFVYINTQGHVPSKSRQILLNDERPSAILAQELLQYCHESDASPRMQFPLSSIRWRDGTEAGLGDAHKLKDLTELFDIIDALILFDDKRGRKASIAQLLSSGDPQQTRLQELLSLNSLNPNDANSFREIVRPNLIPALSALLSGPAPYQEHCERARVIEGRLASAGTNEKAALTAIRIGGAGNWRTNEVTARLVVDALASLEKSVRMIPEVFRLDIGLRGFVSGFIHLLPLLREGRGEYQPLIKVVSRYVEAINKRIMQGWLIGTTESMVRHLRHVTRSETGTMKNYRLDDVPDALGALCASLAAVEVLPQSSNTLRAFLREFLRKRLNETVRQGYVSELKRQLKDQHPDWTSGELKDKAQERSRPSAARHIDRILTELDVEISFV